MHEKLKSRGHWATRMGFMLACAGSAIGLGNIWKFPYIAGMNGGGLFVIIYLVSIFAIGIPIMICEFSIGRSTQSSPVEAFRKLTAKSSFWQIIGWTGITTGFIILSYYSVVAGWAMHYVFLSIKGFNGATNPEIISGFFGALYANGWVNLFWHAIFMALTVSIILGGVKKGIERAARILMPLLFGMMLLLLIRSSFMSGFGQAVSFVFSPDASKLTPAGVLEALGHAFFIDTLKWKRKTATLIPGLLIFLFGIPSALSGGALSKFTMLGGKNFFDAMDYLSSNWLLPLGGLSIAIFVGYRMDLKIVKKEFKDNSVFTKWFTPWFYSVRYLAPLAVAIVFLYKIGLLKF